MIDGATELVHSANRRGYTDCGDTTPGRAQADVETRPETANLVTCVACIAARTDREV